MSRRSWAFWGCATVLVLLALAVGGGLWFYFDLKEIVETHTETTRRAVPRVDLDDAALAEIQDRSAKLEDAGGEVALSGDDINQLISAFVDESQGAAFVRVGDGRIAVDTSVPVPLEEGEDRFFNGTIEFDLALNEGKLEVEILAARSEPAGEITGRGLRYLRWAAKEGAEELQKEFRRVLGKYAERATSIEVSGDRVIFTN